MSGGLGPADSPYRWLVRLSLVQLAVGLAGMIVAIRRARAYDVSFMRGRADAVARDSLFSGTALSAPLTMMGAQSALTAMVAARGDRRAARALQVMGAIMTSGYLAERLVRHRLRPDGWEPLETPLAILGVGLSAAMALLAIPRERR